ncbi:hypothetical protein [Streptomyces sp. NPDC088182]|uniref:hypothetical protein n=1 Tax=Streptomyces sp. NPDC088182 TaxID=3365838 RepID=UPI00380F9AA3
MEAKSLAPGKRDPVLTDQGVIAFPLRGWRAAELLYDGHGAEAAMLLCAGTAVAEAAVHEALEMHQASPGQPVLDPHTPGVGVDTLVHGANGVSMAGFAHASS